jgi:trehalose synthase
VIASRNEYRQPLEVPQLIFQPAINPFNSKNREMSETEIEERLAQYKIPTHAPIVVQVSGFDPWKDPESVILAFNIARREVDANLVLLGNFATDDLEGGDLRFADQAARHRHARRW